MLPLSVQRSLSWESSLITVIGVRGLGSVEILSVFMRPAHIGGPYNRAESSGKCDFVTTNSEKVRNYERFKMRKKSINIKIQWIYCSIQGV